MVKSKLKSALSRYQSISVSSGVEEATPHRLVQMLMEGALDKIALAKGLIERRDFAGKGQQINWALSIINGLRHSLDMQAGGEISSNLDDLYDYMIRRLSEANMRNDTGMLDEVSSLLMAIKSAWDAMPERVKMPPSSQALPEAS